MIVWQENDTPADCIALKLSRVHLHNKTLLTAEIMYANDYLCFVSEFKWIWPFALGSVQAASDSFHHFYDIFAALPISSARLDENQNFVLSLSNCIGLYAQLSQGNFVSFVKSRPILLGPHWNPCLFKLRINR